MPVYTLDELEENRSKARKIIKIYDKKRISEIDIVKYKSCFESVMILSLSQ